MSEYREARASVADRLNIIKERTENRSLIKWQSGIHSPPAPHLILPSRVARSGGSSIEWSPATRSLDLHRFRKSSMRSLAGAAGCVTWLPSAARRLAGHSKQTSRQQLQGWEEESPARGAEGHWSGFSLQEIAMSHIRGLQRSNDSRIS